MSKRENAPDAAPSSAGAAPPAKRARAAAAAAAAAAAPMLPAALQPEALAAFEAAERKKGVVYLGRIPPYMRPVTIRQLLSAHGELGRLHLTPEDPAAARRRVKAGGCKKPRWEEGWVEFLDKKQAKLAAALLNNQAIGGKKKSGFFASDLWVIKYLSGFRWHHLTEKMAYEARVRTAKLRAELSSAKKEAEHYLGQVDLARQLQKKEKAGGGGDGVPGATSAPRRQFKQRRVLDGTS